MQVEKKTVIQAVDLFGTTLQVFECEQKAQKYAQSAAGQSLFFGDLYRREALVCTETGDTYLISGPYKGVDAKE